MVFFAADDNFKHAIQYKLHKTDNILLSEDNKMEIDNTEIGTWNTSAVTNMLNAFNGEIAFNEALDWNVSNVTTMQGMFNGATNFNQDLDWDVDKVATTQWMFNHII
jgi:hypothetical protein